MNQSLFETLSAPVWQHISLALVHFAWQAVLVVLVVGAALSLVPAKNAALRFRLALLGMVMFVLFPLVTFLLVRGSAAEPSSPARRIVDRGGRLGSPASQSPSVREETGRETRPSIVSTHEKTVRNADVTAPVVLHSSTREPALQVASRWQPYVAAAWLAGVCLLSLRLLFSSLSTHWLKSGRRPLPGDLRQRQLKLSRRMRVPRARVFLSTRVRQAMVVGVFRPCILLPASWLTQLTPEMLEAVLAHELAHLRRHDLWAVLFQRLVETLFFYHPAVWWLSRRIDVERELACDDSAVAATGQRLLYAQSLERVARGTQAGVRPSLAATIQGERKMKLLRRVRHVLDADSKAGKGRWWPAGLLVLLLALGVWGATTDAFTGGKTALADDEGERREGDEREERREGDRERDEREGEEGEARRDRERDEREERREGDRERDEREVRRDGDRDREREGDREGYRDRERREGEGYRREGDRAEGDRREGDRERYHREGDRERDRPRFDGPPPSPRERAMMHMLEQLRREVQMLREEIHRMRGGHPPIPRDDDRPQFRRDGDRPQFRPDGDRPDFRRDGDRPRIHRDGDRPDIKRDGDREEGERRILRRVGERDRPRIIRRDGDREREQDREREGDRERDEDRDEPRGDRDEE